jgi:hypothetical protein
MEPDNFRLRTKEITDTPKYNFPSDLPSRPGINTTGKAIQIRVNQYKVTKWPESDIYQYDVSSTSPSPLTPQIDTFHRSTSEMVLRRRARSWLSGCPVRFKIVSDRSAQALPPYGTATSSFGMFKLPIRFGLWIKPFKVFKPVPRATRLGRL